MTAPVDAVIQALAPIVAAVLVMACLLLLVLIGRAWQEVRALLADPDVDTCGDRCRGHDAPRPRG